MKKITNIVPKNILFKRILSNIVDFLAMCLGIWLIVNIYLYYGKWSTLWLKMFWLHIVDVETNRKPTTANLIKRFLIKYIWLLWSSFFIIIIRATILGFLGFLQLTLDFTLIPNGLLGVNICAGLLLGFFTLYFFLYRRKYHVFRREKSSKTSII